MGGRGQRIPGASSGGKFQKNALGPRVPGSLKEALGSKGKPMSVKDSYAGANPYFDESGTYNEYNMNCQRCVVAYEMRRRGYDVVALPTYQGDKLPNSTAGGNGHWMGAFQGARSESVGATRNSQVEKNIAAKMNSYGSGSRAVVRVQWQGSNKGHVFSVENSGGRIRYVDAQTGKPVNIKNYLSASKPSRTQLVRVDNLRVSERAKKSVTKARS